MAPPLQYSCLKNPMDRGAWKAVVHGITKGQTRLSDFTFTFHLHALEKEMATYSSVLAWRIPGTGEPGGLPSMRLQSRTLLKWLSSSSNHITKLLRFQTSRVLTTEFFFFFFFNFLVAQLVKNPPAVQETQVRFLGLEDLLEKGKATHSSILGLRCFPGGSAGKESAWNVGDLGLIPGFGRSPGEGNGYSLQYSGLENSMDCIVHGVKRVRHDWVTFTHTHTHTHKQQKMSNLNLE